MLLGAALAVVIGLSLGLLGGGGSILMLPMLVYVLEQDARVAIAGSLFVVGVTSLLGVVMHARQKRVVWPVGLLVGAGGMAGAFVGGRLAKHVPATVLLVAFAAMMLVTAVTMIRGRKAPGSSEKRALSKPAALALGAAVGLVAGMVGAGGGFLVVPALVLVGGLAMPEAVGTSLLVIAMQALAGFAGHASHVTLDLPLLAVIAGASLAGALAGVRLAKKVSPDTLRQAFGWLVLGMGTFVLGREVPLPASLGDLARPVFVGVVAATALTVGLVARRSAARRGGAPPGPPGSAHLKPA